MVNFWNSIESGLKSLSHFVGTTAHEAYTDVNNIANTTTSTIKDVADKGFTTVNGALNDVVDLGKGAENSITGVIKGAESVVSLPLIILAGGIAFFLLSKNGGEAIRVGGDIAMKKL